MALDLKPLFEEADIRAERTIAVIRIHVEDAGLLEDALTALACTRAKPERLSGGTFQGSSSWSKVLFSAKESFQKSYYSETITSLGFNDVEVNLFPDDHRFVARLVNGCAPTPSSGGGSLAGPTHSPRSTSSRCSPSVNRRPGSTLHSHARGA